jgi:hypothetical protein
MKVLRHFLSHSRLLRTFGVLPRNVFHIFGSFKGLYTLADVRDDAQMILLTAISAFGDSIPPLIFLTEVCYPQGRGTHERRVMLHFDNAPVHSTERVQESLVNFWIQKNRASALYSGFSTM